MLICKLLHGFPWLVTVYLPVYSSILSIFLSYLSFYLIYLSILSIFLSYLSFYPVYLSTLSIFLSYLSFFVIYGHIKWRQILVYYHNVRHIKGSFLPGGYQGLVPNLSLLLELHSETVFVSCTHICKVWGLFAVLCLTLILSGRVIIVLEYRSVLISVFILYNYSCHRIQVSSYVCIYLVWLLLPYLSLS